MRRLAVFLLALTAVAGVVIYQAETHEPPPPMARIHPNVPRSPSSQYNCIDGQLWWTYITGEGELMPPIETGRAC